MSFLGISSTPTLAFALCQLDPSYTGPLIQVRRSIDNAVSNVGIVSGKLDTTTLLSFCANTNGYVTTWYNQNNTGNNAVQATSSLQPQIVTNGGLTATMFGIGAPGMLLNNTLLNAPTSWANTPFSVIMAFNNYSNNTNYISLISTPFTSGSNRISLGTFQNNFDLQNLGQSDAKSALTYSHPNDNLITWTSSNGWSSGGTVLSNAAVFFPNSTINYPYYTTSGEMNLSYPSQTIETITSIGADGSFSGSQYNFGVLVSFPSNLSSSDLYTATLNVANAIGIQHNGAYETSASLEVLGPILSSAKTASLTLEAVTPIISPSRLASVSLEVLYALVNTSNVSTVPFTGSWISVIES